MAVLEGSWWVLEVEATGSVWVCGSACLSSEASMTASRWDGNG